MRNLIGQTVEEAQNITKTWNIKEVSLRNRRKKRIKTHFDELSDDFEFKDPLHDFKAKVFNEVLDILIFEMNSRFESIKNITENFNFLSPKSLVEKSDEELMESAKKFCNKYKSGMSVVYKRLIEDDLDSGR